MLFMKRILFLIIFIFVGSLNCFTDGMTQTWGQWAKESASYFLPHKLFEIGQDANVPDQAPPCMSGKRLEVFDGLVYLKNYHIPASSTTKEEGEIKFDEALKRALLGKKTGLPGGFSEGHIASFADSIGKQIHQYIVNKVMGYYVTTGIKNSSLYTKLYSHIGTGVDVRYWKLYRKITDILTRALYIQAVSELGESKEDKVRCLVDPVYTTFFHAQGTYHFLPQMLYTTLWPLKYNSGKKLRDDFVFLKICSEEEKKNYINLASVIIANQKDHFYDGLEGAGVDQDKWEDYVLFMNYGLTGNVIDEGDSSIHFLMAKQNIFNRNVSGCSRVLEVLGAPKTLKKF